MIHHRVAVGEWLVHRPAGSGVSYGSEPDRAIVFYHSLLAWRPTVGDVGRHEFTQTSTRRGRRTTTRVLVDVVAPPRSELLLTMGDSIASGHGLERRDYFGFDSCWRDADGSYSGRVVARRNAAGIRTQHALVACSGAVTADLWRDDVTGGPSDLGATMTQLDWALAANPGIITLSIGANDLRFDRPQEFFVGGVFQPDVASSRIEAMARDLGTLLERLTMGTDATVVLTTVHNPTSPDPHGVSGCRGECFVDVVAGVVADLNAAIRDAAAQHPTRVLVADADPAFVGHGAPNGRGPDWLRAGGGWLTSRLPIPTRGVHPFCERGHEDRDTWINAADCVHPNGEGHDAYAAAVMRALGAG